MSLAHVKNRWNDVLDDLERKNRVAWLAFFDARLVSLQGNQLRLSFVDAEKFSGSHNFSAARKPEFIAALETSINAVLGSSLVIITE
ncbi:MAG: hypothetical protein EB011_03555 [Actinobacteria bacterium]|nr:hypothetical protein [Actinomycetota bacterium]NDC52051.1 hypothetical protein [Actinomycetota bacterium]NDD60361.1 hypothetical protein [Actinomycetota bacterium]NDE51477.1 hypothetical protein [Actinomycetota bacterium]NDI25044.1 hypothetical protein [Actinomycetota bacterium]